MAPQRPDDPSPLELAIYNFEVECAKYHNGKAAALSATLSKEERQKLYSAQQRDWQHLQRRKKAIAMHAKLQGELEGYRAQNQLAEPEDLAQEEHHPTRRLRRNLHAVGEVQPSPKHAAHHIIMGKGKHLFDAMARARMNLHLQGVGINDPVNGVWLAHSRAKSEEWRLKDSSQNRPKHWASPESPVHLTMHGINYETWVTASLALELPDEVFMATLERIKLQLRFGGYPKAIEEPYDPNWDGA